MEVSLSQSLGKLLSLNLKSAGNNYSWYHCCIIIKKVKGIDTETQKSTWNYLVFLLHLFSCCILFVCCICFLDALFLLLAFGFCCICMFVATFLLFHCLLDLFLCLFHLYICCIYFLLCLCVCCFCLFVCFSCLFVYLLPFLLVC